MAKTYIPEGKGSSNTDLEAQSWLYNTRDEILGCGGQFHRWPKLLPGKRLPKGVRTVGPYEEGVFELIETCADCGMERRLITAPNAVLDLPARYTYKQPVGYKTPKGSGITRRQKFEETLRRLGEDLWAEAQAPEPVTPD